MNNSKFIGSQLREIINFENNKGKDLVLNGNDSISEEQKLVDEEDMTHQMNKF
jgi:hypothetical protein